MEELVYDTLAAVLGVVGSDWGGEEEECDIKEYADAVGLHRSCRSVYSGNLL